MTRPETRGGRHSLRRLHERQLALMVLCAATAMIILDGSAVNVALPSIREDLAFSQANLVWVINAYLLAFGSFLLLAGRLGDLLGRKRIFLVGLSLFVAASALCGLAQSQEVLIAGRALQGLGGAMASAVALGIIVTLFPKPHEQAKALAVYAFVAAVSASAGLLVGAALTEALDWHAIFFVNVPFGVGGLFAAHRLVDENERDGEEHADVLGALLITSASCLGVYAIVGASAEGWTSTQTLGLAGASVVVLALFLLRQTRANSPLVPPHIFRRRNFAWVNAIQILMVGGIAGLFFLGALYMQQVLAYGVLEVGLAFLPGAAIIAVVSLKGAPRLARYYDPRTILIGGLAVVVVGLLIFSRAPVDGDYLTDVLPALILIGAGAGVCYPALLTTALVEADKDDAGLLSGIVNTGQQLGPALGLAVLGTISTDRTRDLVASGIALPESLAEGYQRAFLISAGLVLAALLLTVAALKSAVPRTAPSRLDDTQFERPDDPTAAGALRDPDFLALGMGATNMMAMAWSAAMGKRVVGVEMRGDPALGLVEWGLREEMFHHLAEIDRLMLERFGADRMPLTIDGRIFLLSEFFFNTKSEVGDAVADELVTGFDLDGHIGGAVRHVEFIDDRWNGGEPERRVEFTPAVGQTGQPDPTALERPLADVLARPSGYTVGASDLLPLLRRWLEAIERADRAAGIEPRVRLLRQHRVIDDIGDQRLARLTQRLTRRGEKQGFAVLPDGRVEISVEELRLLDHKGKFRRVRQPGSSPIELGTPALFMVAQGVDGRDAARLGFEQTPVLVDREDGRGGVPARSDYVCGLLDVMVDGRIRRRIASDFDKQGHEYWVRQIVLGHEDDPEICWVHVEVPDYMTFDPINAGLVPSTTDPKSDEYFGAHKHLLRSYFLEQASLALEIPKEQLDRIQLLYGAMYRVDQRVGSNARVAVNGVIAGDSFGNGHVVTSGGVNTGMLGHALRVRDFWAAREADEPVDSAMRTLADGIQADTAAWLQDSASEYSGPSRDNAVASGYYDTLATTSEFRSKFISDTPSDDWVRILVHQGRLHSYTLPQIDPRHPAVREHVAADRRELAGLRSADSKNVRLARQADASS